VTPPPRPALVTHDAARRLPRLALLLFCAAYLLPGLFGRDPWRGADLNAFGQMLAIAEGRTSWLDPMLGGVSTGAALLPHWIGASGIALLGPWLEAPLAARIPFTALLALTLAAVWHAAFHLARTEAAQPLPFAFGGEADPMDYARAIADGALLALIATLGLLQLGHETTPELAQLAALAILQWSLAAGLQGQWWARIGLLLALPALAVSDAPAMSVALGIGAVVLAARSQQATLRALLPWAAAGLILAVAAAWPVHAWRWRVGTSLDPFQLVRLLVWFLWPAWALALLTLWRWRRHLREPHLSIPLLSLAVALVTCVVMGGSDRALMLALPAIATLAAFALPTMHRSTSAGIDWFSVFFFSAAALTIWVVYLAMVTGVPAKPAANVQRLAPGFQPSMSWLTLACAAAGSAAWIWLVRWRTGRQRTALWKSLVLPAGGVALCWLLLMSLWLPLLDYGRSYRPAVERIASHLPADGCVAAPQANLSLVAALEFHLRRQVRAQSDAAHQADCAVMVQVQRGRTLAAPPPPWHEIAREQRPTDRHEWLIVYRRGP
jgi:4-amino-4-deoxy-L-arabinose transferase-like glycosyltransferase